MEHTYEELKHKTVAELREIASGVDHPAVKGHTQMNKEHLLKAICEALNIDMFTHHRAVGENKSKIKASIKQLKQEREKAISDKNKTELKKIRKQIHKLKNQLRKTTV